MAMLGCFCLLDVCRPSPFGIPYTAPAVPLSGAFFRDGILRASWRTLAQQRPFTIKDLLRRRKKGGKNHEK